MKFVKLAILSGLIFSFSGFARIQCKVTPTNGVCDYNQYDDGVCCGTGNFCGSNTCFGYKTTEPLPAVIPKVKDSVPSGAHPAERTKAVRKVPKGR